MSLFIRALVFGCALYFSIQFVFSFVGTFMQVYSAIRSGRDWQVSFSFKSASLVVLLWVLFWVMGYVQANLAIPQFIGGIKIY